jgi:hypothetical protein
MHPLQPIEAAILQALWQHQAPANGASLLVLPVLSPSWQQDILCTQSLSLILVCLVTSVSEQRIQRGRIGAIWPHLHPCRHEASTSPM